MRVFFDSVELAYEVENFVTLREDLKPLVGKIVKAIELEAAGWKLQEIKVKGITLPIYKKKNKSYAFQIVFGNVSEHSNFRVFATREGHIWGPSLKLMDHD